VKVKLDENIPVSLVEALASLGHDVQTVIGQGLTGRADAEIWRQCQLEDRLLMTQDLDFSDARKLSFNQEATQVLSLSVCKIRDASPCSACLVRFSEAMISKLGKGVLSSSQKQKFELDATKLSLLRLEEDGKIRNSLFLRAEDPSEHSVGECPRFQSFETAQLQVPLCLRPK
jgi:predicted nuclease of predicted toxin-antitoxin system